MVDNYTLRQNARAQLGGGIFQNAWLLTMLACLIAEAVIGLGSVVIFGSLLLYGPLSYGLARVTTSMVKGRKSPDFNDLLKGFTDDFAQTMLLGLLQAVFTALWSLLFIIPGIVKNYSYAMSSYIQQDEANKNWRYCLDKSRAMMDGYKAQLFWLDLSFVGWYILGALCLGVGICFVMPYHETARANFYEARKAEFERPTFTPAFSDEDIFGE